MYPAPNAAKLLSTIVLPNSRTAAQTLDDGTLFAVRLNVETREVTFFYTDGNPRLAKETQRLEQWSRKSIDDLYRALQGNKNTGEPFVLCGDVFIRPGMIKTFKKASGEVPVVHASESWKPFTVDIAFTLWNGEEVTITGIKNGVAQQFRNSGFDVVMRGFCHLKFNVQKAGAASAPEHTRGACPYSTHIKAGMARQHYRI